MSVAGNKGQVRRGRLTPGVTAALIGIACLAVFALANAHLVYVAFNSQPDCVAHVKPDAAKAANGFSAARSAC